MEPSTSSHAETRDIAGVLGYLRLDQDNMKHE
jgi:hypothetical protein